MKLKLRENADINVVTGISDILIDSINKKWDNIRDLNSIIVNLNEEGYEDMVPVIESILEDENKNVGKLQQLVELISPTASSIDDGRQEAIDELDNKEEIKVEEMKLDENFPNVPSKIQTNVDPTFGKAVEDKEEDEKVIEDALKENEKLAQETIPKEGDTGKKVTSKALKAMHLSESLFDEDLDFDDYSDFNSKVYNALAEVMFEHQDKSVTKNDMDKALEWFDTHFWEADGDEFVSTDSSSNKDIYDKLADIGREESSENFNLGEEVKLTEATDSPKNKKEIFTKKLGNFVANKAKEYSMNISDEDKVEFIKFAMKMMMKASRHEKMDGKEIADLVNRLFMSSFNLKGEYTRHMEEKLLTEDREKSRNSAKLDIAREQIKRFKEGKMPKDWTPDGYVKDMIKKNHLTKEEGQQLLSEHFSDLENISDFKQQLEIDMMNVKRVYHELSNDDKDSFELCMTLVDDTINDLCRLFDKMETYLYDNYN